MRDYKQKLIANRENIIPKKKTKAQKFSETVSGFYFLIGLLFCCLSLLLCSFLVTINPLTVTQVNITGIRNPVLKAKVDSAVSDWLSHKAFHLIPHGNLLLFRPELLSQAIITEVTQVASHATHTLTFDRAGSTLALGFDSKLPRVLLVTKDNTFLLNEDGTIASILPRYEWLDELEYDGLLLAKTREAVVQGVGKKIFDDQTWDALIASVPRLKTLAGLNLEFVSVDVLFQKNVTNRFISLVVKDSNADHDNRFMVVTPLFIDPAIIVSNYDEFINKVEKEKRSQLSYIDFRAKDKIFACYKATRCDDFGPVPTLTSNN